jgi:hypothetical protein
MPDKQSVLTLHKYFLWATQMREHFYALVPEFSADPNRERFSEAGLKIDLYMSLWYGMLYVVAEGWQELKLSDPAVDSLLASPNLNLLRLYRNGSFHFQEDYFSKKFLGFMQSGDTPTWAGSLHDGFGVYFLARFAEWKLAQP